MAEIEMLEGVRQAPRGEWDALVAEASPFLEWGWLSALEESGAVSAENGCVRARSGFAFAR